MRRGRCWAGGGGCWGGWWGEGGGAWVGGGRAELFDDQARLLDAGSGLTTLHESPRSRPWAVIDAAVTGAPRNFIRAQLGGVVALRLSIAGIEGERKMSQDRSAEDRAGVAAGLAAGERAFDHAVAALIPS